MGASQPRKGLSFDSAEVELRGFNDSDLIIEAVFESVELKKQIFAELDKIAKSECVLATNTSVLDLPPRDGCWTAFL